MDAGSCFSPATNYYGNLTATSIADLHVTKLSQRPQRGSRTSKQQFAQPRPGHQLNYHNSQSTSPFLIKWERPVPDLQLAITVKRFNCQNNDCRFSASLFPRHSTILEPGNRLSNDLHVLNYLPVCTKTATLLPVPARSISRTWT